MTSMTIARVESYFANSFDSQSHQSVSFWIILNTQSNSIGFFSPNIFRWFFNSADVYSLMILVHSFCSILFLTCIIFQFDLVSEVGQNLNISILNVEFIFSKSSTLITPYLRLSMRLWSAFWIFMNVAISVKWQSKATWKWAMV